MVLQLPPPPYSSSHDHDIVSFILFMIMIIDSIKSAGIFIVIFTWK